MKIVDVRCHLIEIPFSEEFQPAHSNKLWKSFREYLVEVFTDESITGIGACWFQDFIPNWDKYIETTVKPFLLEQIVDPCSVEKFVTAFRVRPFATDICPRPWLVEMALWDIIGKKAGLPIYKLFGGSRKKIKAYASVLEPYPLFTVEEWVNLIKGIYSEGFKAVKIHIGAQSEEPQEIIDVIAAIRDELGDKIEIMVDPIQAWISNPYDFSFALKLAKGLEKYEVVFLEEPLPHYNNPELSARLCEAVDIEIAGGGQMSGWPAYKYVLEKGALDIIQPDIQWSGGMSEVRRIAFLAESHGRQCIPHFFGSGIALSATLHVCSVINSPYVEYPHHPPYITPGIRDVMLEKPITIDGQGYIDVPDLPGLGIRLTDSWKNYLYTNQS